MTTFRFFEAGRPSAATLWAALLVLWAIPGWAEAGATVGSVGIPAKGTFADGGAKTCLRCHDTRKIEAIFETPHMKEGSSLDSPAAKEQCESCHGPSARHVRFPLHADNIRFSRRDRTTTKATRNHACLECHQGDERARWDMNLHGVDRIACVDCHAVHMASDPILAEATQTQRCAEGCHLEIFQKQPVGTPHPLEGDEAVLCTACHDPHGPLDLASCLSCHPQQPKDLAAQSPKARGYHERAKAQEIACTECHQGFVHPLPPEISGETRPEVPHADAKSRGPARP